ncbi:MAG: aspartate--tRNA(Asn) ligase [Candidatus Daviesbacteria bacterium]|nr:MAG: aspartate--tRNA(Asn) ligase [Candidatus Daviesbacteria bacterium]
MQRDLINTLPEKVGQSVTVYGFVQVRRDHGKIIFLDILDRSGTVQVVISPGVNLDHLPGAQDAICVTGMVNKRPENLINKNLPTGEIELAVQSLEILSKAQELPFDMGGKDLDLQLPTLLDFRALTLRHPKIKKIFKVQEMVVEGFKRAAQKLDCTEIFTPTISYSSTEGGAEVFKVKYYEHEAFLVQSPQIYKQIAVGAFERVYLISHAYRSEPSITTRHLSESIQMDCELGFMEFEDLLDALELVGRAVVEYVVKTYPDILEEFGVDQPKINPEIPRLKMREAQEIIRERTGRESNEPDLSPEDEREICRWALEEKNSDFVTITHYPTKKRAFYSMPDPQNPEYSLSYDLLFKGVEILSGSQRIHDLGKLEEVMKERGMDPKNFEMYLQAFKFGMPSHGGFSFGLERMTMQILGLANIREASLFPRDMERIDIRLSKT